MGVWGERPLVAGGSGPTNVLKVHYWIRETNHGIPAPSTLVSVLRWLLDELLNYESVGGVKTDSGSVNSTQSHVRQDGEQHSDPVR